MATRLERSLQGRLDDREASDRRSRRGARVFATIAGFDVLLALGITTADVALLTKGQAEGVIGLGISGSVFVLGAMACARKAGYRTGHMDGVKYALERAGLEPVQTGGAPPILSASPGPEADDQPVKSCSPPEPPADA